MHAYDRLMTQYLPISNVPTTFIAALDSTAIAHTFPAARLCGRPPARMGRRRLALGARRRRNAQERRGGMVNIPTELLRTLVFVVDQRSFTKAAQSLGVTQPAVSAQIKRLQFLLGYELLD